jgi:hypothetical protein
MTSREKIEVTVIGLVLILALLLSVAIGDVIPG